MPVVLQTPPHRHDLFPDRRLPPFALGPSGFVPAAAVIGAESVRRAAWLQAQTSHPGQPARCRIRPTRRLPASAGLVEEHHRPADTHALPATRVVTFTGKHEEWVAA